MTPCNVPAKLEGYSRRSRGVPLGLRNSTSTSTHELRVHRTLYVTMT
jgi:hypothetical protein